MRKHATLNKQNYRWLLEEAEIINMPEPVSQPEEELHSIALGDWLTERGIEYMEMRSYEEARDKFDKAIETYSKCYDDLYETPIELYNPYILLAKCDYLCGSLKYAIKAYLKALEVSRLFRMFDSDNYYWHIDLDVFIAIGRIYVELGDEEMALYYHERAVEYLNNVQR